MVRDNLTGFVLAGGKSTRMGRDQAALAIHGRTLLETSLAALRDVARRVFMLAPPQLYARYGTAIPDIFPGCGPLGGIHAALSHSATQFNLIVAVDTPFVSSKFLDYLAGRALNSSALVTLPEIGDYLEPVCAVYSRDFLAIAEQALQRGDHNFTPLLPQRQTLVIQEAELKNLQVTAEMDENVNTPSCIERPPRRNPGG